MGKHEISDKEKIFRDQMGQKVTVNRETMSADKASIPNRQLCDVGLKIQETDLQLKHYDYMGSAAVHIYYNHTLGHLVFASQTQPLDLYKCPEPLASKAFDDLLKTMKTMYGHKPGRLRSGF